MNVTFFSTQAEFRAWLEAHHQSETELLVGYYKVGSNKPTMTWSESVDQALCFGWIDGVRRSVDADSYCIRFTPRRRNSNWSAINLKKVEELTKLGLMKPEGIKAYNLRTESRSEIYSYEKEGDNLSENYVQQFKLNHLAWAFFEAQPPSYKKAIRHWIMSAKQDKTRLLRLEKVIKASEQQKRVM